MVDGLIWRLSLLLPLLILSLSSSSASYEVVSSSPCQSACAASAVKTTGENVVCLDNEFKSTINGTNFQHCVECELGSTAVDSSNGASDVSWGLYNLRYTVSTCVFGFPVEKVSLSTPCQVSCAPLQDAISHNLNTNVTLDDLSYCNLPSFQDTVGINRCAECYGRMDGEAYLANFLQALHIACLQPPRPSQPFPVAANTIFNSTPIATPTPSSSAVPSPGKGANLALIVALPVVFGVLIIAGVVACCFYSARHRRRIMAQRNGMRRIHDKYSPTFPPHHQQYHQYQQNQIQNQSAQGFESAPVPEPIYFSPVTDQKENPYLQPPQPSPPHQPPPTLSSPYYRSYSPADYAQHSSLPLPIDTSQIGPGPDQEKVHTLHDQYFPPPPPPPPPPQIATIPSLLQEGVESLRQHHMKTPSLGLPVPRGKKSLDIQQKQRPVQPAGYEGDHKDAIQLQDYRTSEDMKRSHEFGDDEKKDDRGTTGTDGVQVESPQVFVYDAVNDRYVKESGLTPTTG